ncbi:putative receptor-like protein kinase at5g39000 [Phtheirospermum japonicum]|uniref:non-specific serine/threonine protein kinase n=1 Tax=Phtheirospermum japonicum TaxID=374723 RepID=A0A830AYB2_9LAMI|nr:putative receptor-like protein kinase at5g39000 [Phtheirospermum japonicum]
MNLHQVSIALPFFCFLIAFTNGSNSPTNSIGDVSINCGSIGTFTARNGREWTGDVIKPKSTSFLQIQGSSTASTVTKKLISADPIPHKTARVSRSRFSYAFEASPGQKILRLHFNPSPYKGFKGLKDLFTVEAGPFTLLSNFSASLTADALRVSSFSKEFCLHIRESQLFNITFSPESSRSLDTHAFINGIEVISVPASLSYFRGGDIGVQVVGHKSLVYVDHHTALEIIHRQNIKQISVPTSGDIDDTFPMWLLQKSDKVKNSWRIPVNVGFTYMIRLHFSEMGLKIAGPGDVMFKFLINEMIAQTNIEIVKEMDDENKISWYKDYMVMMRGQRKEGKRDISISVRSYDDLIDGYELLSGFEIFKLSNPDNSLSSPNPLPPAQGSPSKTIPILFSVIGHRNVIPTVAITIVSMICIIVHMSREYWEANNTKEENKPSAKAERLCRRFSLAEIQLATRNFSDALLIGRGGFGNVYKGIIDRGQTTVAVKRLKSNSMQGVHEFLMEIETLSELRHVNLVSLIGYCNEHREMVLVYDYMVGGTLADHLCKFPRDSINYSSLTWKQRLNICIGAGRGLDYLHTGHGVIHRDVKTSNILLDENFVAKVSDFGLAKHEDRSKLLQSHVSTRVKGTDGYLDPHYLQTRKLTRKTDTYAFGVVLLEILCGRPAVDLSVAEDEHILTIWARDKINKGEDDQIVPSSLREEISPASLKTFVTVAERCLRDDPKNRPTMSQVVLQLELALEQQDNKQPLALNETKSASDDINDSVNTGQPTMASTHVHNVTPLPEEQTNSQVVNAGIPSVRKEGKKDTTHKPSRLWLWDAFLNRVKPSKKNDETYTEIWDESNIRSTKYDWDMISAATNQFSPYFQIGHGGFGSVYKGVLPTGQVIAVKRLSSSSRQGLKEFKNEILLLPNLQHRNIIKLLGYSIHREEKLIVYEFMENTSLDTFIGEEVQHGSLQWAHRFKIIIGIARGVVYLHQDSGLRVIHRYLKLSNILVDSEMNPKISDFAMARTLVENHSELVTQIPGTYRYIPPECLLHGKYSVKSDVYSFGIVILEILRGRRRMNASYLEPTFIWELWNEGRAYDLVDESLEGAFPEDEALRCIQVSLLCTQIEPNQRPTMPSVLKMLEGSELLVDPQQSQTFHGMFLFSHAF